MAFIPLPNTAELVFGMLLASQQVNNVIYFEKPSVWSENDLIDLCDNARLAWSGNVMELMSNNLTFSYVRATDMSSASGPAIVTPIPQPSTGGIVAAPTQNNVAAVVTLRTPNRGRSYRGRTYLGGMSALGLSSSTSITTDYRDDLLAGYVAMILQIESGSLCQHVVASRYTNNAPRTTGVLTPILTYTMDVLLDSQRRRLEGRGS